MRKLLTLFFLSLLLSARAQVSVGNFNQNYSQDFNSLDTITSSNMPQGFLFFESGNAANTTYGSNNGSSATGNTYSYGSIGSTERSLGSLASTSLTPSIGGAFVNHTSGTITSLTVSFTMEQWRSGGRTTIDSSEFFYGINTSGINPSRGTWIKFRGGNLISKVYSSPAPPAGALNGNDTANQIIYQFIISNLSVQPNDTVYLRWTDINVAGNDDALCIDNFNISASGSAVALPNNVSNLTANQVSASTINISWTKPANYDNDSFTILGFLKNSSVNFGLNPKFPVAAFSADSVYPGGTAWPNDTLAKCIYKGDGNNLTLLNTPAGNNYSIYFAVVRELDTTYSSGVLRTFNVQANDPAPLPVSSLTINNISSSGYTLNWNKPAVYTDSTFQTLVFLKKGSAITAGTPTLNPLNYVANNNFSLATSAYQNDTAAKCVYSGDNNSVNIEGLDAATLYYALVYVSRKTDSVYSAAATANKSTTSVALISVTNFTINGTGSTTATLTWTKPSGYINNRYSTLVFVKADTAIIGNSALLSPTRYFANPNVSGTGTGFISDANAKCVFKADTNFVNITGMVAGKMYYAIIQVVNDADSVYSAATFTNGMSAGPPPIYAITPCVTTNLTSGLPDSNGVRATLRGVVYGFNQRSVGIQFMMHDGVSGITVLHTSKNFGYTVTEGDSVVVSGTIGSSRGLANINNLDTLIVLGSNRNLINPLIRTALNESTENRLIKLENVKFLTTPAGSNWPTNNSTVNLVNNQNDTFVVRVSNLSQLAGKPLPTTTYFHVTGMGSQTSSSFSAPFAFNGYQLLPRTQADIEENPLADSLMAFTLLSPPSGITQNIQGDSNFSLAFTWNHAQKTFTGGPNVIYTFQLDSGNRNFSNPKISMSSNLNGTDTSFNMSFGDIAKILNLQNGTNYQAKWRIKAQVGNYIKYSSTTFTLPLVGGILTSTGLNKITLEKLITIYPNPAREKVFVDSQVPVKSVKLYTLTGLQLFETSELSFDCPALKGIYLVEIVTDKGSLFKKLSVE